MASFFARSYRYRPVYEPLMFYNLSEPPPILGAHIGFPHSKKVFFMIFVIILECFSKFIGGIPKLAFLLNSF